MIRITEAVGNDLDETYRGLLATVVHHGDVVDTGHWQATKNVPMTVTREIQNTVFAMPIAATPGALASFVKPNMPWAEDHFAERVSGVPTNPGEEYKNWPWYKGNVEAHQTERTCDKCLGDGWQSHGNVGGDSPKKCSKCGGSGKLSPEEAKFSHTYQERMWPRQAGDPSRREVVRVRGVPDHPLGKDKRVLKTRADHQGIRYRYGDLDDVAELLGREPYTRQAYVPIWFPEDTGAHHFERVPCTLGYHFMLRRDRLSCVYNIRSCDLVRYFKDDAYMAGRLTQWFLQRAKDLNPPAFEAVLPGTLTMMIPSLHVFEDEVPALIKKWGL